MADQEPQGTSQTNGDSTSNGVAGAGEAPQLPERIRVHALAKLLGTTSKRILAHLTELGAEARSAQSSLDRTVAESVRDALVPQEPSTEPAAVEPPASAAAPAEQAPTAPAPAASESSANVAEAAPAALPVPEPVAAAEPAAVPESAAAAETPAETAEAESAAPHTSLFTSPFRPSSAQPEPVVFEAASIAAAPLFLPPDAAAAQEERRKRRAEREAKAAESVTPEPVVEETPAAPKAPAAPESETESEAEIEAEAESGADWDEEQSRDEQEDGGRSRRRRRGRRGRGRGRGEQHADHDSDDESEDEDTDSHAESGDSTEDSGAEQTEDTEDEGASTSDGSTRRRRRRRRRKAGEDNESEPSDDDPPNTVVHEREPRNKRRAVDEVQGISGSTRLEAKRQRRRDGREAGRRRPPILTESEFLARREAVDRVMVVREKSFPAAGEHSHSGATTQVAVLEDNILVEHFVTNTGTASMVGNVYLGKVQNVLPSMEAAFVDIGRGRNGVLYAGEVNWEAAGLGGKERKIEQALKPGDTVLVQVSKDPVGHKGARLTTQISLAGRFLVYVPGGTSTGISRKLPDTERKRLKEILRDIVPQDAGVIIRTASEGVSETELARDVERLQATWKTIEKQAEHGSGAPKTLYEEPDLLVKVVRDLFNEDFSKLVIEGDRAWTTVENYVRTVAPDMLARVERYDNAGGGVDVFGSLRIDEQLAKALDRKVWLPSGGTLVIDRTEAMTVIDVNTGKFTGSGGSNLEETVTRNNLEAAEEIVRQMRLRDIGGMIVVDFIDMVLESNRDLVLRRLTESLGRDRTRHQVSEVTSLGLVQMTRKKLGTGLVEAFSTTCEHCHGRGIIVHNYPVETAPSEEGGSGRREGRRRRKDKERDKDKPQQAPAATVAEPVDSHHEEEAAAKRAHPVALAMAAHHGDEEPVEGESEVAGTEADADSEAAEAATSGSAQPVATAAVTGGSEAAQTGSAPSDAAVAETGASARSKGATSRRRGRNGTAVDRAAESGRRTDEPRDTEQPAPAAETSAAASSSAEVAAPAPRRGRRRVARTTAALSTTDSQGSVFVLSDSEQDSAPKFSLDDIAAPEVTPRTRTRRRTAGRAAGAPETPN
ncbi:translation initiation factor IF-2 N-terminal domain-containing protein [Nocardia spumae]|uniref:translation initiation factor IF-2 N-terminal domain-containing protein n=1 Tax=Nocardia spumae TaxID=2887190 RepID=UPI001D158F17|nr:translation initiation factor IF-2 N-terminal domain-containing protein [Nocardia spumae]